MSAEDLSRVIVAQPPLEHLDGPVGVQPEVGVLRWWAGRPFISVIVKATFTVEADGTMLLADEQEALCAAVPSELDAADVGYPSDFVPRKERVDVLLYGHAHTQKKSDLIDAKIAVGTLRRSFRVTGEKAQYQLPLSAAHIRELDGGAAPPVGATKDLELPDLIVDDAEDGTFYNAAAEVQRVEGLDPAASIALEGLSRDGARTLTLPGVRPVLAVSWAQGLSTELEMRCDTVWLDTDRARCILVWRVALEQDDGVDRLMVSLESASAPRSLAQVQRSLARGRFSFAAERAHPSMAPRANTYEPDLARMARFEALEGFVGPEPSISLERYAEISAELAEQREPREDILKRCDLGDDRWVVEERAWLERMADDASRGDGETAAKYGELFMAAQAKLTRPEELDKTMRDWLSVHVALERAADPNEVFEKHDVSLAEWMRLDRRWRAACIADPSLEGERNQLIEEIRAEQSQTLA